MSVLATRWKAITSVMGVDECLLIMALALVTSGLFPHIVRHAVLAHALDQSVFRKPKLR